MVRIALYQTTTGIDPVENARSLCAAAAEAAAGDAHMLFTPEMSCLLDRDRKRAAAHVVAEADNPVLAAMRNAARENGIWIALGSLAVDRGDGMWANRSLLITPDGAIAARYDKIHMFDVQLSSGESWRESGAYSPAARL